MSLRISFIATALTLASACGLWTAGIRSTQDVKSIFKKANNGVVSFAKDGKWLPDHELVYGRDRFPLPYGTSFTVKSGQCLAIAVPLAFPDIESVTQENQEILISETLRQEPNDHYKWDKISQDLRALDVYCIPNTLE